MSRLIWGAVVIVAGCGSPLLAAETRVAVPKITFLEIDPARRAIVDESQELYFTRMERREMAAKTGAPLPLGPVEQQREECRRRYWSNVRAFTADEKDTLRMLVGKLYPALASDYPRLAALPWSFLKVSDRIEGGLPHTRGKHIVLAERVCRQMSVVRRVGRGNSGLASFLELLVHEQVHVLQRQEPALFEPLYVQVWKLEKASTIRSCPWLDQLQLLNPDAIDCPWIIPLEDAAGPRYVWPRVVLREGQELPHMPSDMQMLGIELQKRDDGYEVQVAPGGRPVFKPLDTFVELHQRWPLTSTWYHPHEVLADSLAALFVRDHFPAEATGDRNKAVPETAIDPLRRWLRANLAQPIPVGTP